MSTHAALPGLTIGLADAAERERIYRQRHEVYALELGQHAANSRGTLRDALDDANEYIVARAGDEVVGFVSVTPPSAGAYSLEKYLPRSGLPLSPDGRTFEVRLLTVPREHRGRGLGALLMYAALRWVEAQGGTRIIAMGRNELLDMYVRAGLRPVGVFIRSGALDFEVLCGDVNDIIGQHGPSGQTGGRLAARLERGADWRLPAPYYARSESPLPDKTLDRGARIEPQRTQGTPRMRSKPVFNSSVLSVPSVAFASVAGKPAACFHGGRFFEAIGEDFRHLERRHGIINADVLDAWFDPSPRVLAALREHLPWLLRTSPPTHADGLARAIASARGVPRECVLPGAGSSDLMFLALRHWLSPASRVLILDPMYGEYGHMFRHVVGCRVDRIVLRRETDYRVDPAELDAAMQRGYDLVALVNPNSPTGQHVARATLEALLGRQPRRTLIWIDETYVDYVGRGESLESFATTHDQVVVCKSMSKVYALSGVRAAYLCAPADVLGPLRRMTPPWAVSLPAQVAATAALRDPDYYERRYGQTHRLRAALTADLGEIPGVEAIAGTANFVLFHVAEGAPDAETIVSRCRERGLFLRNAAAMGGCLGDRAIRIAVKDAATNRRMIAILSEVLAAPRPGAVKAGRESPSATLRCRPGSCAVMPADR